MPRASKGPAVRAARPYRESRELWTLDAETDPFHHCADVLCEKCHGVGRVPQPFIWGAYDGENYEEVATAEEVAAFFHRRKGLVYAHNGGKFDYHYLRDHINADQPIMLINGRLSRFRIGECEFRDSLNIFPNTRLADFGVKNEIDYSLMEPERRTDPNVRAEISKYLRQDCVGLWDQVTRYRREYGKALTQASASMKYWEKNHYENPAPRQSRAQFEECKPFYYGGRVQCFDSGTKAVAFKVADINSAYPRAMFDKHPISPAGTWSKVLPKDSELAQAMIRLECTARGCFPWREKKPGHGEGCPCEECRRGELFFPDDEAGNRNRTRIYTVTGWEFIAALEKNAIENINIIECLTFSQHVSFRDYIENFYEMRLDADRKGDKAGKIFGKYFMNSLYGKFGADSSQYAEYVIATADSIADWKAKGYEEYEIWNERTLMERKPTEEQLDDIDSRWRFYNVATAASITGWVRAFLFKALHDASGLIYCDTDSIAARDVSSLEFGKELGKWKDEGDFDRFSIAGKKLYAFHYAGRPEKYDPKADEKDRTWKMACKGVNFHMLEDGPERIIQLASGCKVDYLPEVPTYSAAKKAPMFINRTLRSTVKDMSQAPEPQSERYKKRTIAPVVIRF